MTPAGAASALEDLLPAVVFPVARHAPVLLLVLDGMSAGERRRDHRQRARPGRGGLGRGAAARRGPPRRRPGRAAHADRGEPGGAADRPADRRRPGRRAARL